MRFPFRRWIAGPRREDALARARRLNKAGVRAIINYLGEHYTRQKDIEKTVAEYVALAAAVKKNRIKADISVKPSQLGLYYGPDICARYVRKVVAAAARHNIFVWVDMESARHTDDIIAVYKSLLRRHKNIGITIQARLRRSRSDVVSLARAGAAVRVVKGAYKEKKSLVYATEEEVKESYIAAVKTLAGARNKFAAATHDPAIMKLVKKSAKGVDFEFEMLMGMKNGVKKKLARSGYRVAEYVPYGERWHAYALRRVKERRENLILALRAVFE